MTRKRKEQYKSLAIICIGFSLIGWRLHSRPVVAVASILFISGLLSGFILRKVTGGWQWLGEKIGAVMSRVLLSIVFFVFLSPIAFFYRLFANKSRKGNSESYFVERNHKYTAPDLEKVF
jgi:membrane-bound ClpP family serine protease